MPLRSVEAASRDDAIAAAREQFGPTARVVGVRRVRSGGVLGFFATERYVAEVAPDTAGRPMVPVPASGRSSAGSDAHLAPMTSSPLASASPARARTTAPARNGAAAYAAVSGSGPADRPSTGEQGRTTAGLRTPPAGPAPEPAPRAEPAADEARLSELVGLLAAEAEPPAPVYGRASFPRTTTISRAVRDFSPSYLDDEEQDDEPLDRNRDVSGGPVASAAPSPFTAALARMVSGDREVRQAVEEALEAPASAPSSAEARSWPTWSGPASTAEPSVPSRATTQKEETVGDQVIAPSSRSADRPAEFPAWAAEPEVAEATDSAREEAIAEVLRSALAQGHSDEALAGILRKVLAGASPQTALTENVPAASAEADLVLPNIVADLSGVSREAIDELSVDTIVDMPVIRADMARPVDPPSVQLPRADLLPPVTDPPVQLPRVELPPAVDRAPVARSSADLPPVSLFGAEVPGSLFPAAPAPAEPTWAERASQATLWGAPAAASGLPVYSDAPIWADIVRPDAVEAAPVVPEVPAVLEESLATDVADEEAVDEDVADQDVADQDVADQDVADQDVADQDVADQDVAVQEPVAEATVEQAAEEAAEESVEAAVLEVAPLLARTASDPAPMSLDATTVMPPLSLLPPLPGTRGRGRPPVPPVVPRAAASSAATLRAAAASALPAPVAAGTAPAASAATAPAPASRSLATVTRLPVAPLTVTPDTPDMPELADALEAVDSLDALEAFVAEAPARPAVAPPRASHTTPPTQAEVEADLARALVPAPRPSFRMPKAPAGEPGDVVARLTALGVPPELLGDSFATDVASHGTYAALTRALGRLPEAAELPSGAGEVLLVVGPGVETLRAARSLAASLRLDPERVQWATRGDLAGLVPEAGRMATIDAAIDRRQAAAGAGTLTIVAVDAPMRADAYWMAQMLAIWSPVAVWAVVEATRKPEDLESWLDGLSRVDALMVQDTDLSADPAAVLRRVAAPVAVLDGVRATPHRWASLLCERLEGTSE